MTIIQANQTPVQLSDPARSLVAITFDTAPSGGHILRGFRNGKSSAVNVAVTLLDGTAVTIANVQAGQTVDVLCKYINTTNTTALNTELLGII